MIGWNGFLIPNCFISWIVARGAFPVEKAGDAGYAENTNRESGCFCMGGTCVM